MTPTCRVGDAVVHFLDDGRMFIDGGSMFGALPRVVWAKRCPPDQLNRVKLRVRPVLIETREARILIETGVGNGEKAKLKQMFGVEREITLMDSLREAGFEPSQVTHVINTHLHFDHCGGNFVTDEDGRHVPAFPNARYFIHEESFEESVDPHELSRTSIVKDDFLPLRDSGRLELVSGTREILPGITLEPHRGHLACVMCVKISSQGEQAFFPSDVIPDSFHLSPACIAAIDLYPVDALADKKIILEKAAAERWLLLYYHDPTLLASRVARDGERYKAVDLIPGD